MGMKQRGTTVSNQIKTFPEWTSAHGIPQIGRSRHYYCIGFWAVITLVALAILVWQVVLLIIQYYKYDVSVAIELKFEQRAFPAVTVCNLNPYKYSVVRNYPNVQRLLTTYEYSMQQVACDGSTSCSPKNSTLDTYRSLYGFEDITDTAALQTRASRILTLEMANYDAAAATDTFEEFIQGCSFNTEDCADSDWTAFIDPKMGRCFAFNLDSQHMAKRAGPIYGLRVILKTNISEFISITDTAGMRVLVHDQLEYPFPDIFGYNVQTGSATSVGVTYRKMTRLGEPYGSCTDDKPSGYLFDRDYSTEGCQRTRYQYQMIKACNCFDPNYPDPDNSTVATCDVDNNFDCWSDETNTTTADNSCTQPCNEGVYDVTVSSAKWPSGSVSAIGTCEEGEYGNTTCVDIYKQNGAMVEVFYEKLNYETMEESPAYTLTSLLSDFGGQIGLWLGMSIVSLIEFCVLVFQLCVSFASPKAGNAVAF